jgi:protein-S-isoprenylcysteine O-methyltransferase Ste14
MSETQDAPNVSIHPPTLFFAALVLGYLIRLFAGGSLPIPRAFAEGFGGLLVIVGLGVVMAAIRSFVEAGENPRPATPSQTLLTKGLYRHSRNPIYLGMVLFGVGFGVATSNLWIVVATLAAGVIINFFVITKEEDYLERRFGEDYAAYKRLVRRWI